MKKGFDANEIREGARRLIEERYGPSIHEKPEPVARVFMEKALEASKEVWLTNPTAAVVGLCEVWGLMGAVMDQGLFERLNESERKLVICSGSIGLAFRALMEEGLELSARVAAKEGS